MLLKVRKPNDEFLTEWLGILEEFAKIKCKMKVRTVLWEVPDDGWVKYNTDGAFRGKKEGVLMPFI